MWSAIAIGVVCYYLYVVVRLQVLSISGLSGMSRDRA